jgi:hypothetical protein
MFAIIGGIITLTCFRPVSLSTSSGGQVSCKSFFNWLVLQFIPYFFSSFGCPSESNHQQLSSSISNFPWKAKHSRQDEQILCSGPGATTYLLAPWSWWGWKDTDCPQIHSGIIPVSF